MADLFPSKYERLQRKRRRRAKSGRTYNEDYERGLRAAGYTITKSEPSAGGTRTIHLERDGVGSTIVRRDSPMPERKKVKMRTVKRAPRRRARNRPGKTGMTRRRMGGFI